MARTPSSFTITVVVILSLIQFLASTTALSYADPPNPPPHRAMILPLFLTSPNSSIATSGRRRFLQKSGYRHQESARMRLHDDLIINGYYTTRLWIGTPPQIFALIVDTGSILTYVPCTPCEQCGRHQDPHFQPELSSTYQPLKCNAKCTCDYEGEQCVYEGQYAEMSTSSGVLSEDLISFGSLSELTPQRAVFGCETVETGDLYSQRADGLMGLGRGDFSIVDQLVGKGVISDSFSLCYGGTDIGGGAMVLGDISTPSDMIFSYSDPARSPYYNVELTEIHVAGKILPLNPRVFDRNHGTVMDSGTTYAYLPEAAFQLFKTAIMKELHSLKKVPGPDPNFKDICFSSAGGNVSQLSKIFPAVDMVFGIGQKLSLSPENYLFKHSKVHGAYCLGIFQNGKDPTTLLGGIIVRNTLVMYDREHSRIGFWKTNCSELWERLHITGASPVKPPTSVAVPTTSVAVPPTSVAVPSTSIAVPPILAPSGMPPVFTQTSGSLQLQVGRITFDMLLNVNYSDLNPRITEIANVISQELDVSPSQVHLLNFTAKGNDSLIRWSISPGGSTDYISNATAISMIMRLTEHRMQLPSDFGTYKLVAWHIEPPAKRTLWRRHDLLVLMASAVALFAGISACAIWYVLRHRQEPLTSYKPVGTAAPEQELQPL